MLPIDCEVQWVRIDPYVYSHRLINNNYANYRVSLVDPIQPNSDSYIFNIIYRPIYNLNLTFGFTFSRHGANKLNDDGSLKVNYGGDILVGHRSIDSEKIFFLEGDMEFYRKYEVTAIYEMQRNYYLTLILDYDSFNSTDSNRKSVSCELSIGIIL